MKIRKPLPNMLSHLRLERMPGGSRREDPDGPPPPLAVRVRTTLSHREGTGPPRWCLRRHRRGPPGRVRLGAPRPRAPRRGAEAQLRAEFARTHEVYTYPTRMSFEACWRAAWKHHKAAMQRLEPALDARADRRQVEGFLHGVPCDSGCEALFDCYLLAADWKPVFLSPQELGCADPRLVDPATGAYLGYRPFRGFGAASKDTSMAALAQVPIHAVQRYAMDYLFAVRCLTWTVVGTIEVDGAGHNGLKDAERRGHIGLPEIRVSQKQLEEPGFWDEFLERARDLCLQHGRPTLRLLGAAEVEHETVRNLKKRTPPPAAGEAG